MLLLTTTPKQTYTHMKHLHLTGLALIMALGLQACSDNETITLPNGDGTTNTTPTVAVVLKAEGSKATVSVPVTSSWTAESDAPWCQLTQMSGNGSEQVEVVVARNLTGQTRYANITFSHDGTAKRLRRYLHKASALADSSSQAPTDSIHGNVLRVEQPPYTQPNTDLVLTGAEFVDSAKTIVVKVVNGTSGISLSTASNNARFVLLNGKPQFAYYPDAPQGVETATPLYADLDANGKAVVDLRIIDHGKSYLSVNALHISQPTFFEKVQKEAQLGSDGAIHFVSGNKLYLGGGTAEIWTKVFSGGFEDGSPKIRITPSYCMKEYDLATNTLSSLPNLPSHLASTQGAGCDVNGTPWLILSDGFYYLHDGSWKLAASYSGTALAATFDRGNIVVVEPNKVCTYAITGNLPQLIKSVNHNIDTSNFRYTHDADGKLWVYSKSDTADDGPTTLYRLNNDGSFTPFTIHGGQLLGVAGDYLYTMQPNKEYHHTVLHRYTLSTGEVELLQSMILEQVYNHAEYVDGRFVTFGKLGGQGYVGITSTQHPNNYMFVMSPDKYAPMSLTIINK